MLSPDRFEAITFDCYGTLVDWETGILAAVGTVLAAHGIESDPDALLEAHARHESREQAGSYRRYRLVLEKVMESIAAEHRIALTAGERNALADSLPTWPVFADTVEALRRLRRDFRLGILSNIDDDLFAGTQPRLGVDFEWVVTAEQVGSYKPDSRNFDALLTRTRLSRERILHAAQSLYHDIGPANSAGLATVWVNRRAGRTGAGATPSAEASPLAEVRSLGQLADELA